MTDIAKSDWSPNAIERVSKAPMRLWRALSLTRKFATAGSLVLLVGMISIGTWVAGQIETGVTQNTAATTALYMESVLAPISQELAVADELSEEAAVAIDRIFNNTALGQRVISYKLWKDDGLIAHATDAHLIGKRFRPTENLIRAWQGEVAADFDDLMDQEDAAERARGLPLLEIYSPIREAYSGQVIAVAEFYEVATGLEHDLRQARRKTWIVVGAVGLMMSALLFSIVSGGSRTIDRQRSALVARVQELGLLLDQNKELRTRVQLAAGRSAAMNETHLRRLSSEMHDGPTQMLALAALQLDRIDRAGSKIEQADVVESIRDAVNSAMAEIRNVCRGMAAPELQGCTVLETVEMAVEGHRSRTGSLVEMSADIHDVSVGQAAQLCVFRFVQEGLSNAFRHADGKGQEVVVRIEQDSLVVTVRDRGAGISLEQTANPDGRLGLNGLRDRIESLGGVFEVTSTRGVGTSLTLRLSHHQEQE